MKWRVVYSPNWCPVPLTPTQRKFAETVIAQLAGTPDPRTYSTRLGFVKPGENKGEMNLRNRYIFKPTCEYKHNGNNIRIVFYLEIDGVPVTPKTDLRGKPRELLVFRVAERAIVYLEDAEA